MAEVEKITNRIPNKEQATETAHVELPKKSFTVEFFVGLFTLVGMCAFAYLAMNIGKMKIFHTGYYEVSAEFDNVSGLKPGAPVEIAGVPIGEVIKIQIEGIAALVTLSIRQDVKLAEDDVAMIRTKGIIGDRYVKISPGSSEQKLATGAKIVDTESVVDFEDVIGKLIHKMD